MGTSAGERAGAGAGAGQCVVAGASVGASMYSGAGTGAEADADPYESVGTYKGAGSTGMDEGTDEGRDADVG